MYTLLSGLYKYMFQRDEYCVLILGLDNAGKTTFLEQTKTRFNKNYKGMSLSKITTTVGLNIGTIDVGKTRLMFWDLGGQEELQSLWDKYYAESHGVIYVIDSTDEERLSESKKAFERRRKLGSWPPKVLDDLSKASERKPVCQYLISRLHLVTALTKLEREIA
ncbi:ADP-ribosylation factor-related protein 1 isoform X3 [Rhea pennata]|uniref:ADP-ribosylation factor-related protein 1 isoform X3 n=2 Tax=Rhea pennata TaxID=8795 RepID=UPI002E253519